MITMIFSLYTPTYEVIFKGQSLGYVSNKKSVQNSIDEFIQKGDADNVGYVVLEEQPTYEFTLLKKGIELNDEFVTAEIIDECVVYYRVYGINIDGEEKFIVDTVKEAQEISNKINEEQEKYSEKSKVEISEKFVQQYTLLDDVEVAVNDILEVIEEENNKIVKKTVTYAAPSKVVPEEVLIALRESAAELNFRNPLDTGVITSRYGLRSMGDHKGLDIGAPTGTPIYVAESGVVTHAGWLGGYGYLVKVQHASGYETYYGHCSKFACSVGDEVTKGDLIAYVGSTGRSTGPHLHFEVRIDGVYYDPLLFISAK